MFVSVVCRSENALGGWKISSSFLRWNELCVICSLLATLICLQPNFEQDLDWVLYFLRNGVNALDLFVE